MHPGQAYVQTAFPGHPLMQSLTKEDYHRIAMNLLDERSQLGFPPAVRVIMFRADAFKLEQAIAKLEQIQQQLNSVIAQAGVVQCMGPMPALMPRRTGRYRAQLCLMSRDYRQLRTVLSKAMPGIKQIASSHAVKWVIDVDAYDL